MNVLSLRGWRRFGCAMIVGAAMVPAACRHLEYVSLRPLDEAGFSYTAVQKIEKLDPTKEEVAELVKAQAGGLPESACVDLLSIARGQKRHFAEGEAVGALHAAKISNETILELARLRQIETWSGEAGAIRLTGTSEAVIVAVAQRRAASQPVPSGASLAKLKDAGVSEATMLQLLGRGMTDADSESLIWRKKHGWTDEHILSDFPPKS